MRTRESIIALYYGIEGGKVNDKDDLGGNTGAGGITEALIKDPEFDDLVAKHGWDGDMSRIPYALYQDVMTRGFWDKLNLDKIIQRSPALAEAMYGFAINANWPPVAKIIQTHIDLMNNKGALYPNLNKVDGLIGDNTIDRFDDYLRVHHDGEAKIVEVLLSMQVAHYYDITLKRSGETNEKYYNGWLNRAIEQRKDVLLSGKVI